MGNLATIDIIIFLTYFMVVAGYGIWIYNRKKIKLRGVKIIFLAEGSLTGGQLGPVSSHPIFLQNSLLG
jgi:SSS family solute:Na+ symporter